MVEMEDIRGVRLRKFKLRKIILEVRMHFRHISEVGEGITQSERGIYWWKLILEGWYLLWEAEKDVHVCAINTDLV